MYVGPIYMCLNGEIGETGLTGLLVGKVWPAERSFHWYTSGQADWVQGWQLYTYAAAESGTNMFVKFCG